MRATPTWPRCTLLHERLQQHAAAGHINDYYETNFAIHEAFIALADNRWLAQVIGDLRKILKLARLQQLQAPGRLEQSLSEHLDSVRRAARRATARAPRPPCAPTCCASARRCAPLPATTRDCCHENAPDWIARGMARLLPAQPGPGAQAAAPAPKAKAAPAPRTTHERLQATLRRTHEALSPRALRRVLADLQAVVDPRISEVEGGRRAQAVADWYAQAATRGAARPVAADERAVCARRHDALARRASATRPRPARRRRPGRNRPAPRAGVAAHAAAAALRGVSRRHALSGGPARRAAAAPQGRQAAAARSMPSWSTCSRPGSTWPFWSCGAFAGTRPPR